MGKRLCAYTLENDHRPHDLCARARARLTSHDYKYECACGVGRQMSHEFVEEANY